MSRAAVDSAIYRRIEARRALVTAPDEAEFQRLTEALLNWAHEGGMGAYDLYELCRSTDWRVLPVAGGWLDQPAWFTRAVQKFMVMERWIELRDQVTADVTGLPSVEVLSG